MENLSSAAVVIDALRVIPAIRIKFRLVFHMLINFCSIYTKHSWPI